MCWWCGDPDCEDGKKCRNARTRNSLLNSNTFRGAVRRIERATDRKVAYSPGTPWDGRRPAFAPGVRESVMGGSGGTGGVTCQLCNTAINDTCGHADHKIPWREYTMQSAQKAMQEHGKNWTGGAIPEDFVRVMSSDPSNLQPAHARCNESKSDSMPGLSAGGSRRERQAAEKQEAERSEKAEEQRRLQQRREREERAARRNGGRDRWRGGPGPDSKEDRKRTRLWAKSRLTFFPQSV